jgi:hypothetical protein
MGLSSPVQPRLHPKALGLVNTLSGDHNVTARTRCDVRGCRRGRHRHFPFERTPKGEPSRRALGRYTWNVLLVAGVADDHVPARAIGRHGLMATLPGRRWRRHGFRQDRGIGADLDRKSATLSEVDVRVEKAERLADDDDAFLDERAVLGALRHLVREAERHVVPGQRPGHADRGIQPDPGIVVLLRRRARPAQQHVSCKIHVQAGADLVHVPDVGATEFASIAIQVE